jgi:uncharacterized membrane protein YoaK (UPF0700 family)
MGGGTAPRQSPFQDAGAPTPSVDESFVLRTLTFVLSVIAGSTDTIGFLGLQGLFTAHITGNVVILAAKFLARDPAPVAQLISVPLFIIALILTRLMAGGLEERRIASLLPLLMLQFLLLAGFLAIAAAAGPRIDPNALMMIVAGMLGVAAMAVQNALVRISLTGAPSTAVMTTNVTLFAIGVGDLLLARDRIGLAKGRRRVRQTGQALAGFLVGCALGAACEVAIGLRSLALPAGLALVAVVLGMAGSRPRAKSQAAS